MKFINIVQQKIKVLTILFSIFTCLTPCQPRSFPGGSDSKEFACNARDPGSIPGSGRSPGEGNDNPLQYSCQGNCMDRGAWQATVRGVVRVGHNLVTKPLLLVCTEQNSLQRKT